MRLSFATQTGGPLRRWCCFLERLRARRLHRGAEGAPAQAMRRSAAAARGGIQCRRPKQNSRLLQHLVQQSAIVAAKASGVVLAGGCNLVNNLPAGLVAGRVVELADIRQAAFDKTWR